MAQTTGTTSAIGLFNEPERRLAYALMQLSH
jgi:hypothetical protein